MISFFRKIRRGLLTDNKFNRYLVYAAGEILLVVIGILIALQINNWNENRKEQGKLNTSLTSMIANLEEDIENINQQIKYNEIVLDAIDFAFKVISLPKYENTPSYSYADSVVAIANEKILLPTKTIFNSMESGSQFQWITDQVLTESIYSYYGFIDQVNNITKTNNKFVQDRIEQFIHQDMELGSFFPKTNPYSDKRKSKIDNTKIIRESVILENVLISRKIRSLSEIDRLENANTNAKGLINLIEIYLKQNKSK